MEQSAKRIAELVSALLAVLGVAAAVWVASAGLPVLIQDKRWLVSGLTLGAMVCTRLSRDRTGRHAVRLSSAFVLAAMMLLPAPGGLLVGLAALAAGRGNGVAGPAAAPRITLPATVVALLATQYVAATAPIEGNVHPLLAAGVLFLVLQGLTLLGAALIAGPASLLGETASPNLALERALIEAVNAPLAYLLFHLAQREDWFDAGLAALLIALASIGLQRLDRAARELRTTADRLAARATELATLDSIGREMAASLEPSRVFGALERECRKILPVDYFFVALSDAEGRLSIVYQRYRGRHSEEQPQPLADGIASWITAERRPLRIDDLDDPPRLGVPLGEPLGEGMRSVTGAPLIVEGNVIGVVGVQALAPAAYDEHHVALLNSISRQAAVAVQNARHYEMATIDSLTGLYLRDYFFRRLEHEQRRVQRYGGEFAVLMMDLDGFKEVNDRHGHLAGDRYLHAIGGAIRSLLRGPDMACRYGGDEFCILLPMTEVEGARAIAERLRTAVATLAVEAEGLPLRTTVSIGVATSAMHEGDDLLGLLRKADQALYRAKRDGRDRVVPFAA